MDHDSTHSLTSEGSSLSDKVHQSPANIYRNEGEKAKIMCSHSDDNFDQILWYRQLKDGKLQLLGYMYGTASPEKGLNVTIEGGSSLSDKVHQSPTNIYRKEGEKAKIKCLHSSSLGDKVHQSPANICSNEGKRAKINCSHSDANFDRILWYKQTKDQQLQFLGYMFGNGYPEKGLNVKIEGGANKGETCTLTIEELSVNSSAVYFCAASYHSATHPCSSVQKPAHHIFIISSCVP
ncbi:hypothetical protein INR49_013145, partial [Caranx melampygus]